MTTRITLSSAELQAIYSPAPFDYDFEKLLSWDRPFTIPITPPDITTLSIEALSANAEAIAQGVINGIEATCPAGTPGFNSYLEKHYLDIEQTHTDSLSKLFAKKAFLLLVYSNICNQTGRHTDLYTGIHIYTPIERTLAQFFSVMVGVHNHDEANSSQLNNFYTT